MSNATDQVDLESLEGTPDEYASMAQELGQKLVGFQGSREYMTGGEWRLEFTEESLLELLYLIGGIKRSEFFLNAIGNKLATHENSKTYLSGGVWKWEFNHTALIGLCLWVRKNKNSF